MGKAYDAVQRYIDAMKAKDLDAILDCFHDDVIYHYHVGTRPFEGKQFIAKFMPGYLAQQTASRWRIVNYLESDDMIIFEGVDEYDQPDGVTVAMPYMGIYQLKDGRIWRARDYFDMPGYKNMTTGDANPWLLNVVKAMAQ